MPRFITFFVCAFASRSDAGVTLEGISAPGEEDRVDLMLGDDAA